VERELWPWRWRSGKPLRVGSVLPPVFPAYARVLHPAAQWRKGAEDFEDVPWLAVASWSGRPLRRATSFDAIAVRADGARWHEQTDGFERGPPEQGRLRRRQCEAIVPVLEAFTTTPKTTWFCLWGGWGGIDSSIPRSVARLELPGRRYILLRGPVRAAQSFQLEVSYQSPSLWWPDDRTWFVASEVDFQSTYIGGTPDCIQRLLKLSDIEAMRVYATDPAEGHSSVPPEPRP
jgi:hypothetical protein